MGGFDPDQYLAKIRGGNQPGGGFDPDAYMAKINAPSDDSVVGTIAKAGRAVDSYTGAPVRAAVGALQDGGNPGSAWMKQLGADPSSAPTGADIAAKAGFSTNSILPEGIRKVSGNALKGSPLGFIADKVFPGSVEKFASASPADVAGVGIGVATDPLTYVPLGEAFEAARPLIAKGSEAAADALGSVARGKAVSATGATGVQAAKFAPNAGQELLDQGVVRFGNSQEHIAKKATAALDKAESNIGSTVSDLDKRGATVDQADIIASMRKRADELGKDPSQFGVADQLNRTADRMEQMIEAGGGNSDITLSQAERTKRGFQTSANYNSSAMDLSHAKEAASIYRQAVEDAATKFDPKAAEAFIAAKKQYGLFAPIEEAATKRAATLAQSPHGGLLDTLSAGVGEAAAGPGGAIAIPIARRAMSSRIAPSMAASANAASKIVGALPEAAEKAASVIIPSRAGVAVVDGTKGFGSIPSFARAQDQTDRAPARGPDAWAHNGINKLGLDQDTADRLLKDPKAKQLLIQASDLSPGSPAMKRIRDQIKKGWGRK